MIGAQPFVRGRFYIRRLGCRHSLKLVEICLGTSAVGHALGQNVRAPAETAERFRAPQKIGQITVLDALDLFVGRALFEQVIHDRIDLALDNRGVYARFDRDRDRKQAAQFAPARSGADAGSQFLSRQRAVAPNGNFSRPRGRLQRDPNTELSGSVQAGP